MTFPSQPILVSSERLPRGIIIKSPSMGQSRIRASQHACMCSQKVDSSLTRAQPPVPPSHPPCARTPTTSNDILPKTSALGVRSNVRQPGAAPRNVCIIYRVQGAAVGMHTQ
ncbi:hypothetical protein BU24DRAFT_429023 [Aaosphaeria arxii CBS 175.79]|uniref:Uncharacterized protein n=1 Tax=Aaosphaeria arxii CBS 175.79 TaxID=1450172 RepID=A0A6A5X809_9PLEO|nr:uncharacterized protein BU24DRAFT_429023 [Aaosphaeria arxii CBS 175.79]KAF2009083.1 hypothetical protein BU24DRAFT_429023 [Aaosphaeria arxii CBS 175.79]